jgi:hypothetical protein
MREENMDMDKKLRQLEDQSLPDLSRQEEHWGKMQGLIDNPLPDTKPMADWKSSLWVMAIFGFVFLYWIGNLILSTKTPEAASIRAENKMMANDTSGRDTIKLYHRELQLSKDSIQLSDLTTVRVKDSLIYSQPLLPKKTNHSVQVLPAVKNIAPQKLVRARNSNNNDTLILVSPAPPPADTTPVKKSMTLDEFFSQLRKPEQHFSINNQRDTLLNGIYGTALFIPAGTFDTKEEVRLTMTEYYTYTDIITHQLSTCSNGAPLVTGGMIHLTASSNGKEVNILPSKAIRWFVPDTVASLGQMQLFKGVTKNNEVRREVLNEEGDTMAARSSQELINWLSGGVSFTNTYFTTLVKVLDLRNEPYKARSTRQGMIGKFYIDPKSNLSREELRQQMMERFGYHRVVIRKEQEGYGLFFKLTPRFLRRTKERRSSQPLGDSAWIEPAVAKAYRLTPTDTLVSRSTAVGMSYPGIRMASRIKGFDTLLNNNNLKNLAKRYSVDIRELGWINCDRFYKDNAPRIDYIVNLGDTASNYFTMLVFDDLKSMINGTVTGNRVRFSGIPLGRKARLLSVGIREGKAISVMQPVTIDRQVLEGLKFEETSAPAFKEQVATLDR